MVTIIFESHATTVDNENHLSSGWYDVELSPRGIKQSQEMGERYKDDHFDAIFCSDLQRSYKSADIAFGDKFPIIKDERIRECNYGDMTRHSSDKVVPLKEKSITTPFPKGESFEQASARIKSFLQDLLRDYDGKKVMIVGHGATQDALEEHINHVPLLQAVREHSNSWKWQPGWTYELKELS